MHGLTMYLMAWTRAMCFFALIDRDFVLRVMRQCLYAILNLYVVLNLSTVQPSVGQYMERNLYAECRAAPIRRAER
jgi:hypothetical protein